MSKPSKIMWMSRHAPTSSQLWELERLFPKFELYIDGRSFDGVDDILARYNEQKADEMVVVAPLTVIRALCRRGLKPIKANMEQVSPDAADCEVRLRTRSGRTLGYRFIDFERVEGVDLRTSKLVAPTDEKENNQ